MLCVKDIDTKVAAERRSALSMHYSICFGGFVVCSFKIKASCCRELLTKLL